MVIGIFFLLFYLAYEAKNKKVHGFTLLLKGIEGFKFNLKKKNVFFSFCIIV